MNYTDEQIAEIHRAMAKHLPLDTPDDGIQGVIAELTRKAPEFREGEVFASKQPTGEPCEAYGKKGGAAWTQPGDQDTSRVFRKLRLSEMPAAVEELRTGMFEIIGHPAANPQSFRELASKAIARFDEQIEA